MERLTRVIKGHGNDVIVYTQGKYTDTTAGEMKYKDVRNVMKHLCDYENTGLTPPEIMELKERDTAKEIQKVEEQPYFRKHFHSYICPVCHKKVESGWSFCGHCGQKLKRKD